MSLVVIGLVVVSIIAIVVGILFFAGVFSAKQDASAVPAASPPVSTSATQPAPIENIPEPDEVPSPAVTPPVLPPPPPPTAPAPKMVKFVKLSLPGDNKVIHVAELQVFDTTNVNVALNRPVTASSTETGYGGTSLAWLTDNGLSQKWPLASTTHGTSNPWMMIELVPIELTKIYKCVLFNRVEDYGAAATGEITGAFISLLDASNAVLKEFPTFPAGSIMTVYNS